MKEQILAILNEYARELETDSYSGIEIHESAFPAIAEKICELDNWVSVEDRLPDFGEIVFVYGEKRTMMAQLNISKKIESSSGVTVEHEWSEPGRLYDDLYIIVTHWQPLPKPPKTK